MPKLKSLDELKKIRDDAALETRLRTAGEDPNRIVVAVGMATCGIAAGARETMNALVDEVNKLGLNKQGQGSEQPDAKSSEGKTVAVTATGCIGLCYAEPIVEVRVPGKPIVRYGDVNVQRARDIIQKHVLRGELLDNAIAGGADIDDMTETGGKEAQP